MSIDDLTKWLGPAEPTEEQREQIARAALMVATRYPLPADGQAADVVIDRERALSGAVQVILGDSTPRDLTDAWNAAMMRADHAHAEMTGAIIAASATVSERGLVDSLGLARGTVRKALGK